MLLLAAHSAVFSRSNCMISTLVVSPPILVSLATMLQTIFSSPARSFIMTRNKSEPQGVEALLDKAFSMRAWKVLAAGKFLIQVTMQSETPNAASSTLRIRWFTTSKILLNYKKQRSTSEHSSITLVTIFTAMSRLAKHDRPLRSIQSFLA